METLLIKMLHIKTLEIKSIPNEFLNSNNNSKGSDSKKKNALNKITFE